MRTVHLLNAAVMPHEGYFQINPISPAQFKLEIQAAHADGVLRHYIGYDNTLALVEKLTGLNLGGKNVDQTEMQDGDIFYVARLRRRVSPAEKRVATRGDGDVLELGDLDFFEGKFVLNPASFMSIRKGD